VATVLHITLLDMSNIPSPVIVEVLGDKDIDELSAEAVVECGGFHSIIPYNIGD
jgi:hypothetical protein